MSHGAADVPRAPGPENPNMEKAPMMKAISRIGFALLALVWLAHAAFAAGPSYRLKVDGLACPFCAYGIEKKLGALDGVEGVKTNLEEGTVTVTMKDGATLDEATAKRAVKDAGFTLKEFKQVSPRNTN